MAALWSRAKEAGHGALIGAVSVFEDAVDGAARLTTSDAKKAHTKVTRLCCRMDGCGCVTMLLDWSAAGLRLCDNAVGLVGGRIAAV